MDGPPCGSPRPVVLGEPSRDSRGERVCPAREAVLRGVPASFDAYAWLLRRLLDPCWVEGGLWSHSGIGWLPRRLTQVGICVLALHEAAVLEEREGGRRGRGQTSRPGGGRGGGLQGVSATAVASPREAPKPRRPSQRG